MKPMKFIHHCNSEWKCYKTIFYEGKPKLSPEALSPILLPQVEHAVKQMKSAKAERIHGVTIEKIKAASPKLLRILSKLFTKYICRQLGRQISGKHQKLYCCTRKSTMKTWLTIGLYVLNFNIY